MAKVNWRESRTTIRVGVNSGSVLGLLIFVVNFLTSNPRVEELRNAHCQNKW